MAGTTQNDDIQKKKRLTERIKDLCNIDGREKEPNKNDPKDGTWRQKLCFMSWLLNSMEDAGSYIAKCAKLIKIVDDSEAPY